MHVKDMWLWSTRKHGSGHRRFLEGVFLKCSLRGCIMKTEPSHSSPSSPFSTSFYINFDPPWEHRLKMVSEIFTGLLVQVAKRFQVSVSSGECVGDPEWTPTRSSPSSIVVSTDLSPYRQSTPPDSLHFGYFRMMQVTQDGRRCTQQQVPMSSNVFVPFCSMFVPLDVLWTFWGVRRNI